MVNLNLSLSSGAIAGGTTAGTFKTTATITYLINSIFKSLAATDNLAFSASKNLANNQSCLFGIWVDASGNVTTSQGPIVTTGDDCPPPIAPAASLAAIGMIKVACSSSQTFTTGTTALGTGNTATYYNVAAMPGYSL